MTAALRTSMILNAGIVIAAELSPVTPGRRRPTSAQADQEKSCARRTDHAIYVKSLEARIKCGSVGVLRTFISRLTSGIRLLDGTSSHSMRMTLLRCSCRPARSGIILPCGLNGGANGTSRQDLARVDSAWGYHEVHTAMICPHHTQEDRI
jgi:hypothetical protein